MNRIYEAHFPPDVNVRAHLGCKSAWSNQGLIAYTTENVLEGSTFMELRIFNSQVPWTDYNFQFRVGRELTSLKWNNVGNKLLVGDSRGRISVFTMVDNSSTDWSQKIVIDDMVDPVITVGWFHPGIKYEVHIDKVMTPPGSDPPSLSEKITREKFAPTLANRGGTPIEGVFGLTRLGRFVTTLTDTPEDTSLFVANIAGNMHVKHAGYAFTADGKIVIALSSGLISEPIRIVEVRVKRKLLKLSTNLSKPDSMTIDFTVRRSLVVPQDQTLEDFGPHSYVTQVKFPHDEYADQIMLCYSNDRQSCLSWWMNMPKNLVLPKCLGGGCQIQTWMQLKQAQLPKILDIASQNLPVMTKKLTLSTFSCGDLIAVTCLDGTLYLIQKLTLKTRLQIEPHKDLVFPDRGEDSLRTYVTISFSPSGCALLGVDNNSNLFISQVNPWLEADLPVTLKEEALQLFIEYGLLTDMDSWDARMLLTDQSMTATITSKLQNSIGNDDEYSIFKSRFDAECLLLWSIFPHFELEYASKLSTLLTTAMLDLFVSFLRPTQAMMENEFDSMEKLAQICDSSENLDDLLNTMISTFETNMRVLQSVGHLIQWMASHIISQVTKLRTNDLSMAEVSVSRQLLLITKLWTTLHNNCSPLYTIKDAKCDPLSESYRILSKVSIAKKGGESLTSDLYDSCEQLKCKVAIGEVSMKTPVMMKLKGKIFEIGSPADNNVSLHINEADFVRRTIVGTEEIRDLRHCSRSGVYTYNRQESLISGWDYRFLKRSMCGGLWTNIASKRSREVSDLSQESI